MKTIWAVACLASVPGLCLAVFSGCGTIKSRIQEFSMMDVGEGPRKVMVQLTELQKEPAGQQIQAPPPSVYPSGKLPTSRPAGVTPAPPPSAPLKNTPAPVIASSKPRVPAVSPPPMDPSLTSSQPMSSSTVPVTVPSNNPPTQNIASGRTQALPETGSPPSLGNQASAVPPAKQAPSVRLQAPPEKAGAGAEDYSGGPKYRVGTEDILHVSVWDNKDLTLDVIVRPDGKISLPLIQDVQAEGLSVSELAEVIRQKLLVYIKEPAVSVMVKEVNATKFYVLGYVTKPGIYALRGDMSVLEALSMAGGFTPFASPRKIRLLRNTKKTQEVRVINYYDLIDSGKGNYLLMPGDTIVVP